MKKKSEMGYMVMDASLLHRLWALIENTQTSILIALDDAHLIERLINQLEERQVLDREEVKLVSQYLGERVLLIRDLAYARRGIS